ncbi:potassium transporter TrkG [Nibrella saemangeumensis]|uniref:Potassium transporter TrkG n=1 Tax=Nibrella saemangeumensis TaxID=1084526 RepID=A0ABP8NE34_9BACT
MNRIKLLARWSFIRSRQSRFFLAGLHEKILEILSFVVPGLLTIGVGIVIYEFGFKSFWGNHFFIDFWLEIILGLLSIAIGVRLVLESFIPKSRWARIFNIAGWLFLLFLTLYVLPTKAVLVNVDSNRFLFYKLLLYAGILLGFVTEASYSLHRIYSRTVNPGLLFIGSFVLLIFLGAFLLKLPNATNRSLSTLDALFTATSAVCVTGLIVVDTATHFTAFGQVIILLLIQLGGLGFMTFAGLLAYAVAGNASIKTQLAFKDIMSSQQINNIMFFVYQVVFVTLLFEGIGAVFIYFSLDDALFVRQRDKLFFSMFHAVSAFCNAGFSTYTNGLYESVIRFNYTLQMFLAVLIILGGMGFPIVFNLYRYTRIKLSNVYWRVTGNPKRAYFPSLISLNSRLALVVSIILLLIGFMAYLVFEQSATLLQHPTWGGKLVTSFFGSVTPRTAGFNTVDLTQMTLPTIMFYLLLMWIGASPGSTGGGIKTTTAGLAVLNMVAVIRGKERTDFFRSEISHQSVRRAFAIIMSSLLYIGFAVFVISINDSGKGLIAIAFEVFSAFSTVGLSLGITANLTLISKVMLMLTMFVGRVGMLTLLVAFIRQSKQLHYRYPKEEIAF